MRSRQRSTTTHWRADGRWQKKKPPKPRPPSLLWTQNGPSNKRRGGKNKCFPIPNTSSPNPSLTRHDYGMMCLPPSPGALPRLLGWVLFWGGSLEATLASSRFHGRLGVRAVRQGVWACALLSRAFWFWCGKWPGSPRFCAALQHCTLLLSAVKLTKFG